MTAPVMDSHRGAVGPAQYEQVSAGLGIWFLRLLSIPLALGLALAVMRYPAGPLVMATALLGYAALLWYRPLTWLFVVPALLPVFDFAPLTGWFFLDEFDFLLAVTVLVASWRLPAAERVPLMPGVGVFVAVLTMFWFLSMLIGVLPGESIRDSFFENYMTKYNALRVAKGYAWAILLWPLAARSVGADLRNLERYFFPGLLAGLVMLSCAAAWERAAFTGLSNFSSPYRITASFSSMHVGGGALDGYLALTAPVTWWLISRFDSAVRSVLGIAIFALAAYAVVATFSRGLYAGFVAALLIIGLSQTGSAMRDRSVGIFRVLAGLMLLALFAFLFARVFASGGYRALAAALVTLAAGFFVGAQGVGPKRWTLALASVVPLALLTWLLYAFLAKGAYVAFALSALTAAGAGAATLLNAQRGGALALAAAAFLWCALNSVLVGAHWGGRAAMAASLAASLAMLLAVAANVASHQALWRFTLRGATLSGILAMIFLVGLPIVSRSYFIGERMSVGSSDLDRRIQHWRDVWNMRRTDALSQLLGNGVGRFPVTYYWKTRHLDTPGVLRYMREGDNVFARLIGPGGQEGSSIYLGQQVSVRPNSNYSVTLRARASGEQAQRLSVGLCEIWVLFSDQCAWGTIEVTAGGWRTYTQDLASAELGRWRWFGRKPIRLILVNSRVGTAIDVDALSLSGPQGTNMLRNGDFTHAPDRWFFSTGEYWPWHVESTWLSVLFETGWLGFVCMLAVFAFATARLLSPRAGDTGPSHRTIWLASLGAFAVVATFNSQFEFPRVTTLFFLMLLLSLLQRSSAPAVDALVQRSRNRGAAAPRPPSMHAE